MTRIGGGLDLVLRAVEENTYPNWLGLSNGTGVGIHLT